MLKTLITYFTYFTLIFAGLSQAQQSQSMLICTPHLNELVSVGVPRAFIFQRGNNYCAYIGGDNSAQMVEDGINWLLNRIAEAFIVVEQKEPEFNVNATYEELDERTSYSSDAKEWLADHPDVAAEILRQKQDSSLSLNGLRHFSQEPGSEQEDWLEGFLEFWDVDGIWNEDMGVGK